MDTRNLIKSVIQENIVESKRLATEILMQKLSERLQSKFDEVAPETFLDEEEKKLDPVGEEDEDINNDGEVDETDEYLKKRRAAIAKAMGEKDEDEDEDEEDEKGEDGLVYEDGLEYEDGEDETESDTHDSAGGGKTAEQINREAFHKNSVSE